MSFPRYPSYKDSGVEWLGAVPEHWGVLSLKHNFRIVGGSTPKSEVEAFWDGDILWATPSDLSKRNSVYINDTQRKITADGLASCGSSLVPLASIILSTRAPIGSLAISEAVMCTNQGCKSLVPAEHSNSVYFAHLLSVCTTELNMRGKGTTFLEISGDELGAFRTPTPPLAEQTQIAAFLDRETAKIDALVAEQRRLMELLKEKRQAVISHAVTKGLNPNAPMKPSGIEWLGNVPEHWILSRIKYSLSGLIDTEHKTAPFYEDGEYLVVRTTNIKDGKLLLEGGKYTNFEGFEEWTRRGKPEPGDIMFTREAPAGEACLVPVDLPLCMGQRTVLMQVDQKVLDSNFALWSLYGGLASEFITIVSQGSTVVHFNMADISNIPMMLPPVGEQRAIATFLGATLGKFEILTTEAQRAINLLQERRTALISAAVTGQIDVRHLA